MSASTDGAPGRQPSARTKAESWFLERGLPSVLTRRGRWRRLWSRSAPVLAAYATMQACGIPITLISGSSEVFLEELSTPSHWVILGIIVAALPVAALVGFLLARLPHTRARTLAGLGAAVISALAGVFDAGPSALLSTAEVVAFI